MKASTLKRRKNLFSISLSKDNCVTGLNWPPVMRNEYYDGETVIPNPVLRQYDVRPIRVENSHVRLSHCTAGTFPADGYFELNSTCRTRHPAASNRVAMPSVFWRSKQLQRWQDGCAKGTLIAKKPSDTFKPALKNKNRPLREGSVLKINETKLL